MCVYVFCKLSLSLSSFYVEIYSFGKMQIIWFDLGYVWIILNAIILISNASTNSGWQGIYIGYIHRYICTEYDQVALRMKVRNNSIKERGCYCEWCYYYPPEEEENTKSCRLNNYNPFFHHCVSLWMRSCSSESRSLGSLPAWWRSLPARDC